MTALEGDGCGAEFAVPAGTYFLGDPCNAVPDDEWQQLIERAGYFLPAAQDSVRGHLVTGFLVGSDGWYHDQHENQYPVDSGLLGLVASGVYEQAGISTGDLERAGRIVTFAHPVTASMDADGWLIIGRYAFDTRGSLTLAEMAEDDLSEFCEKHGYQWSAELAGVAGPPGRQWSCTLTAVPVLDGPAATCTARQYSMEGAFTEAWEGEDGLRSRLTGTTAS